jgi:N6-L-threonylcarbamoyladenine synthase
VLILGIETSCDETSVALVENGRLVRANVVSSQIRLHAPYGGVVPEIASRQHVRAITHVTSQALQDAGLEMDDLDAVAVTRGPGLAGALLVGYNFARGLSLARTLPMIPINHLDGHLHSVWLTQEADPPPPPDLPLLALIVSGGHTELVLMRNHGEYEIIGRTLDDAAGEAFDKVARLLGLAYPGGPAIQKAALSATTPTALPRAWLPGTRDFSFSGLKTAVLHVVRRLQGENPSAPGGATMDIAAGLSPQEVADIAAGFQESVVDVLAEKTRRAADELDVRSVAVVGGVAANAVLRARMQEVIPRPLFISAPEFSTDNAAMIAGTAFFVRGTPESDIEPGLALAAH